MKSGEITSISFIIPVLNGERFMARCLDSIGAEMASGDEIIVVDNGSTDGTLDILSRYSEVKVLHAPGINIGAARNRGSKIAKGEVFAFIDSDCLVCEGWREAAQDLLNDPSVDVTGSHFDVTQPPSWVEQAWIPPRRTEPIETHYIPSGNLVVRRGAYEAIDGFDESLATDEDTDIGHRLSEAGYTIIDAPRIRVIHLGNAQTLAQFTKKEKWHATNILNTMYSNKLDKPMVMTFLFMLSVVVSIAMLPFVFAGSLSVVAPIAVLLVSPVITAVYRSVLWKKYLFFPHQVLLYFVFYLVRSIRIVEVLGSGIGKSLTGQK